MSFYRSYFQKNNTIVESSMVNTSKNPATQIWYGSTHSKFLFTIDLSGLQQKITNGDLVLNSNTKHYLKLTNTVFGDESLMFDLTTQDKQRATSFDLILFPIQENWDEGVGFDYVYSADLTQYNINYDVRPSNWFNRTSLDPWTHTGVFSTVPPYVINTIHFDNGNENINCDITNYINGILTGNTINYGIGLCFDPNYLNVQTATDQTVAFFTKYTQTFFEPFLETVFDDVIIDNRDNFIIDIPRNLYLYVTKGTNFYDLDFLPTVDVLDSTKTVILGLSNLTTQKIRKGIYMVTIPMTGQLCDGKRFFYDVWKNISIDGFVLDNVTQRFIPKPINSLFTIGENQTELERYVVQFFGVKMNEKIKLGSTRKIVVTLRSINKQIPVLFDEIYYRIYIKEGKVQVIVFDWTLMDKTNENSFLLDTSYLIPREYSLEIKALTHTEEIFYNDEIKFEIVSEQ